MSPAFPDIPDPSQITEASASDRFGRAIAVATVVTTLAAALVAFLQAGALRIDDEAAVRAERLSAATLGQRLRAQSDAQMLYERFEQAEQQRARAGFARSRRFFGADAVGDELGLEEARWLRVAEQTDRGTRYIARSAGLDPIPVSGPDSPERDDAFPGRFFTRAREEGYRLGALRDAANEEGDRAEAQVVTYAVSLTMFAVAVFLFGYSLTPQGRPRRTLYAGVASAFVVVSGTFALVTVIDAPRRAPDEAAAAYARGRVAQETDDQDGAIRALTRAIELRPTFHQAYFLRGQAEAAKGSPQVGGIASLTAPDALRRTVEDFDEALELGSEEPDLLIGQAFNLLALGLEEDDESLLERSLELTRAARPAYERSPIPDFNEGATLLALGRPRDAEEAYDRGARRTVFADERRRVKRNDVVAEEDFVAGALTDLELVLAARPDLDELVRRTKQQVVAPASAEVTLPFGRGDDIPPTQAQRAKGTGARMAGMGIDLTPAFATLRVDSPARFDPAKDRVSVQWYHDERGLGWSVLPQISGPVTEGEGVIDASGAYSVRRSYLQFTNPPTCLPPGRYRAEVYVNGGLAGESSGGGRFGALEATRSRDLGVLLCRPRDWAASRQRRDGLVDGYTSADGSRGAYVVSVNREVVAEGGSARRQSEAVLDTTLEQLGSLAPGRPRGGQKADAPFIGLDGEVVRAYDYPGGRLLAGAGVSEEGELLVGITFGPPGFFESGEAEEVFTSISLN